MRWPWSKPHQAPVVLPDLAATRAQLERIRAQRPAVDRLGQAFRHERERNHWGETVAKIARGGQ